MNTEQKIARRKPSLLELASDLGNVSKACKQWVRAHPKKYRQALR